MLAYVVPRKRKRLVPPSPVLLPKKKRQEIRVFLDKGLVGELDRVTEFHGDVFEALKAEEKVARNDIIAAFLQWAIDAYWEDKGGNPTSERDWAEKVKRASDVLRREQQQQDR